MAEAGTSKPLRDGEEHTGERGKSHREGRKIGKTKENRGRGEENTGSRKENARRKGNHREGKTCCDVTDTAETMSVQDAVIIFCRA